MSEGPDTAFTELFRAHCPYVVHSLRRLGVREADLEDVAHEVFLVVHRTLPSYDPARPLKPWLFGIALRVASDYRRLAHLRRATPPAGAEPTAPPSHEGDSPHELLVRKQTQERVIAALDKIPLERRGIFVLHEMHGHTMPEVADALGVPLNTAYTRLRTARAEFREAFERLAKVPSRPRDGAGHV